MEQEQLISAAQYLAFLILSELRNEYDRTENGTLINEEVWCVSDFDELVHDYIKEYDYLNDDILSNMIACIIRYKNSIKEDIIFKGVKW